MSDTPNPSSTGSFPAAHSVSETGRMQAVGLKAPGSAMIVFDHVTKTYLDGAVDAVGLDDVSVRIDKGDFVFLVGPSGSGKSTFMRCILKELDPDQGRIMVGGRTLTSLKRSKVPQLRRNIGCVYQDYKLLPNRTVYENVAYALRVTGSSKAEIRRKVPEIIHLVGLAEKIDSFPDELSGGEQQRVSIARAFVNHPPLLIADEPTGNLDPETSVGIMDLLTRINRTGTTVLIATHDVQVVNQMRRRVIALEKGRLVSDRLRASYDDSVANDLGLNNLAQQTGSIPSLGHTGQYPTAGNTGSFPRVEPGQQPPNGPFDPNNPHGVDPNGQGR